jgi:hypothetical protein
MVSAQLYVVHKSMLNYAVGPFPSLAEMRTPAGRRMKTQRLVWPQKETTAPLGLMAALRAVVSRSSTPALEDLRLTATILIAFLDSLTLPSTLVHSKTNESNQIPMALLKNYGYARRNAAGKDHWRSGF